MPLHRSVAVRAQALAMDHLAGRAQLFGEPSVAPHDDLHLGSGRCGLSLVVGADEQQVAHGSLLHRGGRRPLTSTTPMARRNWQRPTYPAGFRAATATKHAVNERVGRRPSRSNVFSISPMTPPA